MVNAKQNNEKSNSRSSIQKVFWIANPAFPKHICAAVLSNVLRQDNFRMNDGERREVIEKFSVMAQRKRWEAI